MEIGTKTEENKTARAEGENPAAIELFMEKTDIGTQIRKKETAKGPDLVGFGAKRKIIIIIKREISTTYKNGAE